MSNYSEWHYLWMGVFIGLTAGFALGVWVRHRLLRLVHTDVVHALSLLGIRRTAGGGRGADAGSAGFSGEPQDERR